jgi:hypothetical protein
MGIAGTMGAILMLLSILGLVFSGIIMPIIGDSLLWGFTDSTCKLLNVNVTSPEYWTISYTINTTHIKKSQKKVIFCNINSQNLDDYNPDVNCYKQLNRDVNMHTRYINYLKQREINDIWKCLYKNGNDPRDTNNYELDLRFEDIYRPFADKLSKEMALTAIFMTFICLLGSMLFSLDCLIHYLMLNKHN